MFLLRPANQRGHTQIGWLDSYHTFSFSDYYDPQYMGFSDLRVINDDVVAPSMGFGSHPHRDMEIISLVLSGELEHKDSMGNGSIIKAGEIQQMTAGSGIFHSEYNPSDKTPVHFLQIWIMPESRNLPPSYAQKSFDPKLMTNQLLTIVSGSGRDGSLKINQDAEIYQCLLEADEKIEYLLNPERKFWIQIATGSIEVNGQIMVAGDGMSITDENEIITFRGIDKLSNFIVFNLRP